MNKDEAIAEADCCRKIISSYKIDLPIYYDFEYDTERYANEKGVKFTKKDRTEIIMAFCDKIKQYGYSTGVYINQDYIKNRTNFENLKKYNLWLAAWIRQSGAVTFDEVNPDNVNKTYGTVEVWQIGKEKIDGIVNAVDVDYGYYKEFNCQTQTIKNNTTINVNSSYKIGDKVKITTSFVSNNKKRAKTYSGSSFVVYYDAYDVIAVSGDKVLIGINKVATAYVNAAILSLTSDDTSKTTNTSEILSKVTSSGSLQVGKLVKVKLNATDYNGRRLSSVVYTKTYYIYQLKNDRAVLSTKMSGGIIAAVNVKDLILYG